MYRRKKGTSNELDSYLSRKHDELLASTLEPGTYKKTLSLVIVDGFAVEITEDQVSVIYIYIYDLHYCIYIIFLVLIK